MVCSREIHSHCEVEGRAAPPVAVGPDPSALRFDDRLTDCQAHPASLRLRREECVKYLVGLAQRQPGTCVVYRDLDLAVLAQQRPHGKHAARVLHRLDTIQHEVHQHLLQLHPIRPDFGEIRRQVRTTRSWTISPMTSFIATNSRLGGVFLYSDAGG
jgi:hypothetical protein